jgi:hypothetical protein
MEIAADSHLGLVAVLAILALFAAYGVLLWAIRSTRTRERDLRCPDDGRTARVRFLIGPSGRPVDVDGCSLRAWTRCSRRCLQAT